MAVMSLCYHAQRSRQPLQLATLQVVAPWPLYDIVCLPSTVWIRCVPAHIGIPQMPEADTSDLCIMPAQRISCAGSRDSLVTAGDLNCCSYQAQQQRKSALPILIQHGLPRIEINKCPHQPPSALVMTNSRREPGMTIVLPAAESLPSFRISTPGSSVHPADQWLPNHVFCKCLAHS